MRYTGTSSSPCALWGAFFVCICSSCYVQVLLVAVLARQCATDIPVAFSLLEDGGLPSSRGEATIVADPETISNNLVEAAQESAKVHNKLTKKFIGLSKTHHALTTEVSHSIHQIDTLISGLHPKTKNRKSTLHATSLQRARKAMPLSNHRCSLPRNSFLQRIGQEGYP